MSAVIAGHRVRPVLLVIALLGLAVTIAAAVATGTSGWWVALGLVAPDLVPLVRFTRPTVAGRMPTSMVGLYNATHALPGPIVLAAGGALLGQSAVIIVAAAWLVHIVWDRSVGYGLRTRAGVDRSHAESPHAEAGIPRR